MRSDPLISVIVPVYDVRPYLAEALESVCRQTYPNLEVIAVDDGSTDGSGDVLDAYAACDARFRVVHQENRGVSMARNVALDMMEGELVAFVDSDDAWEATFVETMLRALVSEDADVAICRYRPFEAARRGGRAMGPASPRGEAGVYGRADALRALADGAINMSMCNRLCRRRLWEGVRFPVGRRSEDIYTSFRILDRCSRCVFVDEPLYLYRRRPGSYLRTNTLSGVRDRIMVGGQVVAFMEGMPDVFTPRQVSRWRQYPIKRMIACYAELPASTPCAEREWLRARIVSTGEEFGVDTLDRRTRAAWRVVRDCPCLLGPAYAASSKLGSIKRRATWR